MAACSSIMVACSSHPGQHRGRAEQCFRQICTNVGVSCVVLSSRRSAYLAQIFHGLLGMSALPSITSSSSDFCPPLSMWHFLP